jgi:uncharacterized protein
LIHLLYHNGEEDEAKKPEKVYMHNTNLLYAIMPENTNALNLRHTFFFNQLSGRHDVKGSDDSDFIIDHTYSFVVGGRKTDSAGKVYAAADMIEIGEGNKIPLWLFGFLY